MDDSSEGILTITFNANGAPLSETAIKVGAAQMCYRTLDINFVPPSPPFPHLALIALLPSLALPSLPCSCCLELCDIPRQLICNISDTRAHNVVRLVLMVLQGLLLSYAHSR